MQFHANIPSRHLHMQLQRGLGVGDNKAFRRFVQDGTVETMLRELQQDPVIVEKDNEPPQLKKSWFKQLMGS